MKKIRIKPSKPALIFGLIIEIFFLIFGALFLYTVQMEDTTPLPVYAFFALWFLVIAAFIVFTIGMLKGKLRSPGIDIEIEDDRG